LFAQQATAVNVPLSKRAPSECGPEPGHVLPNYDIRQLPGPHSESLSKDSITALREALHAGCWPKALKIALRQYRPELPAWIVYIDSTNRLTQGFSFRGDTVHDFVHVGNVWAVVFSDKPLMRSTEVIHALGATADAARTSAALSASGENSEAKLASDLVRLRRAIEAQAAATIQARRVEESAATLERQAATLPVSRRSHVLDSAKMLRKSAADLRAAGDKARFEAETTVQVDSAAIKTTRVLVDQNTRQATITDTSSRTAADTADLRFARRTVTYRQDPMLTVLVTGLLKPFGGPATPDAPLPDSIRTIRFERLAEDSVDQMRIGYARFSVTENTAVELSLAPFPGKEFAGPAGTPTTRLLHVYSNLANAKQHTFELGALAGLSAGQRIPSFSDAGSKTGLSAAAQFAPYLCAFVNLGWFSVPWRDEYWRRGSTGVFLGTNFVSGNFGDQLVGGFTLGHLISDAGLNVGTSWQVIPSSADGVVKHDRRFRFLTGIDLRF
jgi:hypothetical protein